MIRVHNSNSRKEDNYKWTSFKQYPLNYSIVKENIEWNQIRMQPCSMSIDGLGKQKDEPTGHSKEETGNLVWI